MTFLFSSVKNCHRCHGTKIKQISNFVPQFRVKSRTKFGAMSAADEGDGGSASGGILPDMETLRRFFADKLGLDEKVKVLDNVSVDGIVEFIKEGKCKNIVTLAGAGISTAAGVPDFRSPGTGLYDNLQKYNLPYPEAVFDINYFSENPKPFFALAKELYPEKLKPTICHYFIKLLEQKKLLLRHYTQNIDTLERVAGISEDKIIEAHGTFHYNHCMECRKEYSSDWVKDKIFKDKLPLCEVCPGIVKPDIVFYGENLSDKFYKGMMTDFKKCDLMIIMGSSLQVQPFASIVSRAKKTCPRLLINFEKVGDFEGLDFDSETNTRDVAWLGDCDEGCKMLAEKLGYLDELMELYKKGHENLDAKYKIDAAATAKDDDKAKIVDVKPNSSKEKKRNAKPVSK